MVVRAGMSEESARVKFMVGVVVLMVGIFGYLDV